MPRHSFRLNQLTIKATSAESIDEAPRESSFDLFPLTSGPLQGDTLLRHMCHLPIMWSDTNEFMVRPQRKSTLNQNGCHNVGELFRSIFIANTIPATVVIVVALQNRFYLQSCGGLRTELEKGTLWREDITGKVGGVGQGRSAAVHGVDRHSRVVASIPKDQLDGIVRRRQG